MKASAVLVDGHRDASHLVEDGVPDAVRFIRARFAEERIVPLAADQVDIAEPLIVNEGAAPHSAKDFAGDRALELFG